MYQYVPVHVLPMYESVWTDILGMGWGISWDHGETEIKSNRFTGTCMPKALGTG